MRSVHDLKPEEFDGPPKLTKKESAAVDALVAAVKKLPKGICLDITYAGDSDDGLSIDKVLAYGFAKRITLIRKRSLIFSSYRRPE